MSKTRHGKKTIEQWMTYMTGQTGPWRREIDGAKEAARGTRCDNLTIVTRDKKEMIEEDGYRIEVVGIEEWLTRK